MDLDFSFALVSSLTPRSHITRTPLSDTNKLSSSKAPKIKQKLNLNPQNCDKIKQLSNKENQNNIPKDQQMNKNVAQTRVSDSNFIEEKCKDDSTSICFPLDMANIAVRRSKVRSRRRKPSSLQEDNNSLRSPCKDTKIHSSTLSSKNSFCCSLKICCDKQSIPSILSNEDFICSRASLNSDNIDICTKQPIESSVVIKGVKRKSLRLSELSSISTDVVESSELEFKINESNNSFSNNSVLISECAKLDSIRLKNLSKSSLSPAYDSDSFKVPRRQGVKAILETPETDKSLESNLNSTEDRKVILETPESDKTLESNLNSSEDVKSLQKETKEIEKQKGSINISDHYRENINLKTCKGLNVESSLDKDNKFIDFSINTPESDENPKKKLRSSKDSSVSDLFKLEPSIKNQPSTIKSDQINFNLTEKDKRKQSLSPVLKDINTKDVDSKTTVLRKGKQSRRDKPLNRKKTLEEEENKCKPSRISLKEKNNKHSPIIVCSPKSNLIPPTEVIPKFEHISNWLKDTQEKSASLVGSDFSIDSSKEREKKPPGRSKLLSLSPRIKNKKKIAESTLREEQKLFEELYGDDLANRLSDDVEDVISIASSNEPVQLSEKVLEKLYGTVWQKSAVLPQSEPRKGRKNTSSLQKNVPLTERKKKRTSIYDVFSSSSSEDRFEEFLESVQRGKLDSVRRRSNQPDSPEFINDSDSDSNTSVGFYHTIVTKAVKEDAKSLRDKAADGAKNPRKVNRRRLSFTSSKDEWSEGEKLDTKLDKSDTISIKDTKKKNRKRRSKKKTEDFDNKISANVNDFTLVTPLKVKDKKDSSELSEIIKKVIECAEPKSVGKSKNLKKLNKKVNNPSSEENFRKKYLGADGFKVPTNISSFKTPTKQPSATVLSSPALSFLSSLSEMTAGLPCHPDALVYKKDFKNKREELTKKLFNLFNKEVFDDKLPADMLIQWSARMTSTSGYCYNKRIYINNQIFRSSRIVLSTKILDRADRLRDTLVHEMCHAATWIVNATSDGHGPNWKAWADKANSRFPELPVIKRCHDYAISTKFTYKCMSCGYCIGRHSKSLDTDRKRCGYCYGKFQVFVTAKMSAASATSGSDSVKTQRNPTGFALFVKEHYAAVKKQHNVPHGQVMKLLSQKFADVKISKQSATEPLLVE